MDYRGTFEDGVIRPEGEVNLPNGTPVEFHPVPTREDAIAKANRLAKNPPTLAELTRGKTPITSVQELGSPEFSDFDVDEFLRSIRERP